jgi:hypothetical protein
MRPGYRDVPYKSDTAYWVEPAPFPFTFQGFKNMLFAGQPLGNKRQGKMNNDCLPVQLYKNTSINADVLITSRPLAGMRYGLTGGGSQKGFGRMLP